jgi:hypothetical protein
MVKINKTSKLPNCNKSDAYVANALIKILYYLNLFFISYLIHVY